MSRLRFAVTEEMVDRFAELIGDRSSLHVDPKFARRSPFRRRVVHGVLPLMYLARSDLFESGSAQLTELSARFHRPAFPGDELELHVTTSESESSGSCTDSFFEYRICRGNSGEDLTVGTLRVRNERQASTDQTIGEVRDASMSIVPELVEERVAVFGELSKGEESSFGVRISSVHIEKLHQILALGKDRGAIRSEAHHQTASLLLAACSSTYVGMRMPGRFATFTELTLKLVPGVSSPIEALFLGEVAFLSASTQTAVAKFSVTDSHSNGSLAKGQIKVRVSDPPVSMPSMGQIQREVDDMGLRDRVVLVTGASRGIGEVIAKAFAAQGARLVINYYSGRDDAQRVVDEIAGSGGTAIALGADVSQENEVERLVGAAAEALGPVDILINNAVGHYEQKAFENVQWSDVQNDIDIIVKGAFNCCRSVLPSMLEREYGRIVNLSTSAVEIPTRGHTGYIVAKSALLGLTRSLAVEYASKGIRVNAVMPGMVETDLTSNVSKMERERIRHETPMKRLASSIDVARTVLYLASDWSSYTTGQQIAVTGGHPPFH